MNDRPSNHAARAAQLDAAAAPNALRLYLSTPCTILASSCSSAFSLLFCSAVALHERDRAKRSRCTSPRRRFASVARSAPPTTAISTAHAAPAACAATLCQVWLSLGAAGGRVRFPPMFPLRCIQVVLCVRWVGSARVDDEHEREQQRAPHKINTTRILRRRTMTYRKYDLFFSVSNHISTRAFPAREPPVNERPHN